MTAPRRKLSARVVDAYAFDRRGFAVRLETAVDWDRTTYRAVAVHTGVPLRQVHSLAHARPVMDWAYHAIALWVDEAEARISRAMASRERRLPTSIRAAARKLAEEIGDA